jgi:hypothetical protein
MVAKLTRLTHKIAIQLHPVAESCTICSSRSRRPVLKLLDTTSYCRTAVAGTGKNIVQLLDSFCKYEYYLLILLLVSIAIIIISSHDYFPCHFFSWTNVTPHNSGFKFHIIALSLLCAMSLAQLYFLGSLFLKVSCSRLVTLLLSSSFLLLLLLLSSVAR